MDRTCRVRVKFSANGIESLVHEVYYDPYHEGVLILKPQVSFVAAGSRAVEVTPKLTLRLVVQAQRPPALVPDVQMDLDEGVFMYIDTGIVDIDLNSPDDLLVRCIT